MQLGTRSDDGPEFVAFELTEWLADLGAYTHRIEPGKLWQNAFGEGPHAPVR